MYGLLSALVLLILGYLFGRFAEYRHYQGILRREKEMLFLPAVTLRTPPDDLNITSSTMVSGSVVISLDYFKRSLAGLKKLFGGRITSYESLLDRGRREAILRMKQQALAMNASMVWNVRLETSAISQSDAGRVGSIEMFAWGTALTIHNTDEIHRETSPGRD